MSNPKKPAVEKHNLFAVCAPGLELFTDAELKSLGISTSQPRIGQGGVEFNGAWDEIYLSNHWSRTATRILLRLAEFKVLTFAELVEKTAKIPWENYLPKTSPLAIRVTCSKSKLYHSGAVKQRVLEGIAKRIGSELPSGEYDEEGSINQRIVVRLDHDICQVSIDTSGTALYKRGYRLATGKAGLRETLAAAMLYASSWDRKSPLVDPFCGSGVIPIEAALMAKNVAPGSLRSFAFQNLPAFLTLKPKIAEPRTVIECSVEALQIFGSDRDCQVIEFAKGNAKRAGVLDYIDFECKSLSEISAPSQVGWIVTNPPYGKRISENQDMRNLYSHFGDILRMNFPSWHVAYLCNDEKIASRTKIEFTKGYSLNNGGIPVKLSLGTVK